VATKQGKFVDLIDNTERYKARLYQFFLDFGKWREFKPPIPLPWKKISFDVASKPMVPKERGLYVFTLELPSCPLPQHGYIMYVGHTGNTSAATLRSRFGQYLDDLRRQDGRGRVYYMLERFKGDIFFSFVPVADRAVDLKKIEVSLINSVAPPVNTGDFDIVMSHVRRTLF